MAALEESVRLNPNDGSALSNLASALTQLGRHEESIELFKEATRLLPELAAPHINLGLAYLQLGMNEAALAACKEAIRLEPEMAQAHAQLGNACGQLGRHEDAIAACREAVRLQLHVVARRHGEVFRPGFAQLQLGIAKRRKIQKSAAADNLQGAKQKTAGNKSAKAADVRLHAFAKAEIPCTKNKHREANNSQSGVIGEPI